MRQITTYRTRQGLDYPDPRQAQLVEDVLDALDRFFSAQADEPSITEDILLNPVPKHEIPEDIEEILTQMAERKLSGRALAKKAHVSPSTMSALLHGKPVGAAKRAQIAEALAHE